MCHDMGVQTEIGKHLLQSLIFVLQLAQARQQCVDVDHATNRTPNHTYFCRCAGRSMEFRDSFSG